MTSLSSYAFDQPLPCDVVAPGDTAARLAQRFTGEARNWRQPWFQIVNPATAASIPKSRYGLIESGWYVCIAPEHRRSQLVTAIHTPDIPQHHAAIDTGVLRWVAFLCFGAAALVLVWVVREYLVERRTRVDVMRIFGAIFLSEFERPLLRRRADEPAIKSRLRFAPARRRLEIMLAPADGRSYPNLLDHRKNVEYDVNRVVRLLSDESFMSGPLFARGPWVVIPFQVETNRE